MSTDTEKRSSAAQMPCPGIPRGRVGGRQQAQIDPPGPGGGYLDVCHQTEFGLQADQKKSPRDPRLADLRKMGLPQIWISIAELIGFDSFIEVWAMMDSQVYGEFADNAFSIRVRVPMFRKYQRYQRDEFIRTLTAPPHNLNFNQILKRVRDDLGIKISINTVKRSASL